MGKHGQTMACFSMLKALRFLTKHHFSLTIIFHHVSCLNHVKPPFFTTNSPQERRRLAEKVAARAAADDEDGERFGKGKIKSTTDPKSGILGDFRMILG